MFEDLGLLILRVVVGAIILAHGLQKFGYLGGRGLASHAGFLESGLGFRPGVVWAWIVALTETVGGLLMIVGLGAFLAPFAVAADMAVAGIAAHGAKGFWSTTGGYEFTLALGGAAVASGLAGYGRWSLDALVGLALPDWLLVAWAALVVVGVIVAFASREIGVGAAS